MSFEAQFLWHFIPEYVRIRRQNIPFSSEVQVNMIKMHQKGDPFAIYFIFYISNNT